MVKENTHDFLFTGCSVIFMIFYTSGNCNKRIKNMAECVRKPICWQVKSFNRQHQLTGCKTHRLCTVHSWQTVYHKTGWCKSLTAVGGIEKNYIKLKSLEESKISERENINPTQTAKTGRGKWLRSENYANRWRQSRINGPQHFQALKELSKDTIGEPAWPQ